VLLAAPAGWGTNRLDDAADHLGDLGGNLWASVDKKSRWSEVGRAHALPRAEQKAKQLRDQPPERLHGELGAYSR
jgi:hypothetical protein